MGKPFKSELQSLSKTLEVIQSIDIEKLQKHLCTACVHSVILVGAGGSLSVAEFAKRLFDEKGTISYALTPLEFLQSKANLRKTSVFIFSAGGNNKDVLAVLLAGRQREAASIVSICARRGSKLSQLSRSNTRTVVFDFDLPSKRDGYLATNSLFASCLLLNRAFDSSTSLDFLIPKLLKQGATLFSGHSANSGIDHYVLLYSSWGKIAAVDMESKLSEAGLAASMLCDYRHFAHGRHNWLHKQGSRTAVLAFITPDDELLAEKTLNHIPKNIPILRISTNQLAGVGAIELLVTAFGFIDAAGLQRGIDPGRPGVPGYGSKLYRLGPVNWPSTETRKQEPFSQNAAISRKANAQRVHGVLQNEIKKAAEAYWVRLKTTNFGALVSDVDGTLLPKENRNGPVPDFASICIRKLLGRGIPVVLATGRGDSINAMVKEAVPKNLWENMYIGYLNGAFILPLANSDEFTDKQRSIEEINRLEEHLISKQIFTRKHLSNKGWQLSVRLSECQSVSLTADRIQEELCSLSYEHLRVVISSHSIDVIHRDMSKGHCIRHVESIIGKGLKVLALGDCGAYPGNDFDLLRKTVSLSVDTVSGDLESCWNFLPPGISHTQGTERYFSRLQARKGYFQFVP